MTQKKLWIFSAHAESRGASRFNLLLDEKAKAEISKQLDGSPTLVTTQHGRNLYEISIYGIKAIVVCDVKRRTVVTVMEAKRWYRGITLNIRKGRNLPVRPSWRRQKDRIDEDMEDVG